MFLVATLDSAVVFDVPNKLFIPDALHWANVDRHCGILPWNKTRVVHSSKFEPHTSPPFRHAVYASIHSAFANKLDVVVVVPEITPADVVIVGIRRIALPIMLGRAVTAKAADVHAKTATKTDRFIQKTHPVHSIIYDLLYHKIWH